jgi:hypothetical protein
MANSPDDVCLVIRGLPGRIATVGKLEWKGYPYQAMRSYLSPADASMAHEVDGDEPIGGRKGHPH